MLRRLVLQSGITIVLIFCPIVLVVLASPVISNFQFGPVSDGLAAGSAWIDANRNGVRDTGEEPLQGACLWAATTPYDFRLNTQMCQSTLHLTDAQGKWEGQFFPGLGSGSTIYVFAQPPQGYAPTTDLVQRSANSSFGFVSTGGRSADYDQARGVLVEGDISAIRRRDLISRIGLIIVVVAICGGLWLVSGRLLGRLEEAGFA